MKRLAAVVVVALLAAAPAVGCRDDPEEETVEMDVNEAKAAMEQLFDRTAEAVGAATGPIEVISDRGPAPCQSERTGQVVDAVQATLTVAVPVPAGGERAALDEVRAAWDGEGLAVDDSRRQAADAELLVRGDGFGASALAVEGTGQVSLMGTTDCLEAAEG